MNLTKKKILAAKVLGVGVNRVLFNSQFLPQIKEAITRQDIKSLHQEGIISIKPVKGRKKIRKIKIKRGFGKIKKKIKNRKQIYVKITRKLRRYLKQLKNRGVIEQAIYWKLRTKIKNRDFKNKSNLKEHLKSIGVNVDSFGRYKVEEEGEEESKKKIIKKPKESKKK